MDSKALQRDFTEDPNGIHKDSKAFQRVFITVSIVREFIEISRHSKGHFAS